LTAEVTLETERLVLRMFGAADFEAYAAICGDPEVMRFEWHQGAAACR
jgi:RimJ/RimL family protein N-acetyltransferase